MNIEQMEKRWRVTGLKKYGFVYKWKNTRTGKFYIGSHWGRFNDGYICSSNSMRRAYERQPDEFTRRILAVVTTTRLDLLAKEQAYLDKIPRKDFGAKSYNVSTKVHKPWWAKGKKVKQNVIAKLKESWNNPERKAKTSEVSRNRVATSETRAKQSKSANKRWRSLEERAKQSEAQKKRAATPEGKAHILKMNKNSRGMLGHTGGKLSKEHKRKIAETLTGIERSPETLEKDSIAAKERWQSVEYRKKISDYRQNQRLRGKLKLNMKQAATIRKMYATGKHTMATLSQKYGVSQSYIHNIIRNDRWAM